MTCECQRPGVGDDCPCACHDWQVAAGEYVLRPEDLRKLYALDDVLVELNIDITEVSGG